MDLEGVVQNGVIVPDDASALPEGTRVRIIPAPFSPHNIVSTAGSLLSEGSRGPA